MRVLIAGAGIAGLTTALSLHAAGIDVLLVEAATELRPLGVGINLPPHAVRELTELGLAEDLERTAIETAEQAHFDRFGGLIWREPRGRELGYRWPQYSVHRGELQMILLAAVRRRLGLDAVRTGTLVTGFTDQGTVAYLKDRASEQSEKVRADVLVGADGLYSAIRAQLHPYEPPPRWGGVMMWRGMAEGEPFLTGATLAVAGSNAGRKFVAYPVARSGDGKVLINWVAEAMLGSGATPAVHADWNRGGRLADVLPWFADWKFSWLDIPDLLIRSPRILEYPMVDRDPLPFWGQDRVTLAGDAAHPMYPIGSNGAAQAIIDARVLAASLASASSPDEGLRAYEAARHETTARLVLANRDMPADRILHQVSVRAPEGFDQIEDVLTADELRTIGQAYRTTTFEDVDALNTRPPYL
ncbi:MAG: flavin-dependent oxidoreductase [Streptosporangiaceae bacterium]|jgi:2-polyprenyl-6-methoxyphenol hydroxylase-like FAD-dependent oxidoreductase